ncbi:MAG: phage holin family protein [Oscillospiraceae bacterium]|nr:phage holin family protein [Oscillospiraceae bacterium]
MFDIDSIWDYVIAGALGMFGGLVRLLNKKDRRQFRKLIVISELCVSGFSGLLALLMIRGGLALVGVSYNGDLLGLVCGMAGLMGTKFLDKLESKVNETVFNEKEEKDNQNKKGE